MSFFRQSELQDLIKLVEKGERLDFEAGVRLLESKDLLALGYMANLVRERKNGNKAYFIVNRHINHTNVCVNLCRFCAYGVPGEDSRAFTLTLAEIEEKVRQAAAENISEVHIVGGLNPELNYDYYLQMLQSIKRILPHVCLQAFTAVEIDYFTRMTGYPLKRILTDLRAAGLDSLPGGGAEIFSTRVRNTICPQKISGGRWLEIHETAHGLGMRTNATILYGHVETTGERTAHMLQLRELQDKTRGFLAFIPLPFSPGNTQMEGCNGAGNTTGFEDLKMLAVSRILLDNFEHIKAFWIMLGLGLAQVSLHFGVDDLDGTVIEERIIHATGVRTGQAMPKKTLVNLIQKAGREAVERDTLYRALKSYPGA
ncbi:MAG: aminofutalosine synthase MqnE [Desulfitobacteriaceae bacterium]|nr:aminofutalosine synthase MqnE [Desulfitobacteriaceae bacterium]MDD4346563.1 aminofutalosine synthase MqnE [Desulfitobacteriaceae bacterium]MDD4401102.1 aminofutalosine synthase MqnE [Desulfitobacteriaceae bacterium]